jgi:hypothetical protein
MHSSYSVPDMQKRIEIETLRTRWRELDISSKDAFFKEMADQKDLKWGDIVEDLVPVVNYSQVETFLVEVE